MFQPGDQVICVDASGSPRASYWRTLVKPLQEGRIYTVRTTVGGRGPVAGSPKSRVFDESITFYEYDPQFTFNSARFRLATAHEILTAKAADEETS